MLLARLQPWSWWIGVLIAFGAILTVIALGIGYLNKVVRPQYPSRRQRRES
jgi:hypothetical protein